MHNKIVKKKTKIRIHTHSRKTTTEKKLFGQGKENEYDDDITVVRGPPGPPGIDGNLFNIHPHNIHLLYIYSNIFCTY